MICLVIPGPTIAQARKALSNCPKEVNLIELRLDLIEDWTLLNVEELRHDFPEFNVILTLRPIDQGGGSTLSTEERMDILCELAKTTPEYIDIEYDTPLALFSKIKEISPRTKIILSIHNFQLMPDLKKTLDQLKQTPADLYKIAVQLDSTVNALKLLIFQRENPEVVIAGMGLYGKVTRILSPIFGGRFVYASSDDAQAGVPGQLSARELIDKFNFMSLNSRTEIYALIGEPIDRSPSTLVYNALFKKKNYPGVYVKFPLKENTLSEFLELIKSTPVRGLSITSPVKELMYTQSCDEYDADAHRIEAINTVVYKNGKKIGYTTDGFGAADAFEKFGPLAGKKMLVIGAGGAVKSIINESMKRGAVVTILNRTPERAAKVAADLGCKWDTLENIGTYYQEGYDILVNGTTAQPIADDMILPGAIVFDLQICATDTKLLSAARKKGCKVINGYEMWVNQGSEQCRLMFGYDPKETKQFMNACLKKMWHLLDLPI